MRTFRRFFSKIFLFFDLPQYSKRFDYIRDRRRASYFNNQENHCISSLTQSLNLSVSRLCRSFRPIAAINAPHTINTDRFPHMATHTDLVPERERERERSLIDNIHTGRPYTSINMSLHAASQLAHTEENVDPSSTVRNAGCYIRVATPGG